MLDSLRTILKRCERDPAVLYPEDLAAWPPDEMETWINQGVLESMSPAAFLPCPGCGGEHGGEVVFLHDTDDGEASAYLTCSECGPSRITPECLCRWRVSVERLAEVAFAHIVPSPQLVPLEPNRLWRIGKAQGQGDGFTVFFGRQLHRDDVPAVLRRFGIPSRAVVFTAYHSPTRVLHEESPLILPLGEVLHYDRGRLRFHHEQVADRLAEWRESHASPTKRPLRKRASRAADIAALTCEMQEHLRTARDYAHATRERTGRAQLLPRPTQQELARRTGASQWTVSRCLNDPEARELSYLWKLAADLDRLLGFGHS